MGKDIVIIKDIDWIDKEIFEAEVLFEINGREFWAFCHPCHFRIGDKVEVSLDIIEEDISKDIFWNENKEHKMEIIPSKYNRLTYYCYGKVKNIHPVLIDIGLFTLPFGDWINDENVIGNYVYFVISRLDISYLDNSKLL